MSKVYRVGLVFNFEPEGEHEEIFSGMLGDEEKMIHYFKSLVSDDIDNLVKYNEVYESLRVEVIEQ